MKINFFCVTLREHDFVASHVNKSEVERIIPKQLWIHATEDLYRVFRFSEKMIQDDSEP